jgi:death-on-curing protein
MDEPTWIDESVILQIHELQLEEHGGLSGIRDRGLLSSAVFRSRNLWAYAGADFAALAAAYAIGIARNHPFNDGNKRTAAVACELFLRLNDRVLQASDDEWYETMIRVATGAMIETELADWIQNRLGMLE